MADLKVKISEFPPATISKDSDDIAILQDGINKKIKSPILESKILDKVEERYVNKNKLGVNNGVATLGSDGKLSESQRFTLDINTSFIPIDLTTPASEVDGVFLPTTSGVYVNYGGLTIDLDLGSYLITKIGNTYKSILLAVESTLIANNIDDLRSKEPAYEGQIITLLGYYEAGDKEPLNYKWTSEQGVDDGGSVINTDSGSWMVCFNPKEKIHPAVFGIKNDNSIDQSEKINSFVKYHDDNDIYEIDFRGYSLQSPKTVHFVTSRGSSITGVLFKNPHKICNLELIQDKDQVLQQGATLISFCPQVDIEATVEFENLILDPYVENYNIVSGEADGHLIGIAFIGSYSPGYPLDRSIQTQYTAIFRNVRFSSCALSYNVNLADIFLKNTIIENVYGEYLGLFFHTNSYDMHVDNLSGIFRDDIHSTSGRVLVTNLIQEEAEIGENAIQRNNYVVKNCECRKYTDNSVYVVYKQHAIGIINQRSMYFETNVGKIETFIGGAGDNEFNVDVFEVKDHKEGQIVLNNVNNTIILDNSPLSPSAFGIEDLNEVIIKNCNIKNTIDTVYNSPKIFNKLKIQNCTSESVPGIGWGIFDYGLIANVNTLVREFIIDGLHWEGFHFIECKIENLKLKNVTFKNNNYSDRFIKIANPAIESVYIEFHNFIFDWNVDGEMVNNVNNCTINYTVINSKIKEAVQSAKSNYVRYYNSTPTLRSLSNPTSNLYVGYEYYNTADNSFKKYNGVGWI